MKKILSIFSYFVINLSLCSCAALTGIPGHGGGKRFAVEQELVSAATRSAIKQIDLTSIRGSKINLYVNAIGDTGSGNLVGGRFSIISQLHGDYMQSPAIKETYVYPRYETTSKMTTKTDTKNRTKNGSQNNTGSSHSTSVESSKTSTLLNAPSSKTTKQKGFETNLKLGLEYKGLGAYHNSEEIKSDDLRYLNALLQSYLYLQGVVVVPPSEAEVDVYITVDVFGTVYTRVDWFLANNEILRAKTAMEVFAINHETGAILMQPQIAVSESEYNEQYILWAGPVKIRKSVRKADPLLSDFTDVAPNHLGEVSGEAEGSLAYPFRHEMEKFRQNKRKSSP